MAKWVCSQCGGDGYEAPAHPSFDDRMAVGFCDRCTPVPIESDPQWLKRKPVARRTVPLVRRDLWNPDTLRADHTRKAEQKLLRDWMAGKLDRPSDQEKARAVLARYEAEARSV